jgi:hypothetical protein
MRIWFIRVCVALVSWLGAATDGIVLPTVFGFDTVLDLYTSGCFDVGLGVVDGRVDFVTFFPRCLVLVFDQRAQISYHLRWL